MGALTLGMARKRKSGPGEKTTLLGMLDYLPGSITGKVADVPEPQVPAAAVRPAGGWSRTESLDARALGAPDRGNRPARRPPRHTCGADRRFSRPLTSPPLPRPGPGRRRITARGRCSR